jgi:hypothetical protein
MCAWATQANVTAPFPGADYYGNLINLRIQVRPSVGWLFFVSSTIIGHHLTLFPACLVG